MAIVGQIVLFNFPQTDLIIGKKRPALVLKSLPNNYQDWLVCMGILTKNNLIFKHKIYTILIVQ